jgi:predicted GTPase
MILGKVSAGKSSLLNQVFDKQLATGRGDTTK